MISQAIQYVDPVVSRTKFERELAEYRSIEREYRARGWFLVEAEWPLAIVILASNTTNPPTIVIAAQFDYTNYDAEPPSVRFVDPFSGRLLPNADLPIRLFRTVPGPNVPSPDGTKTVTAQDLVQASSPKDIPFLCIAGVKEYHDHPGHSGDPWELHRPAGGGRLVRLLEVIGRYGLETVTGLGVTMSLSFARSEPPQ